MLQQLYKPFQHWTDNGAAFIISDTHFDDSDTKLMDSSWPDALEQVRTINKIVGRDNTLIILGDVGKAEWVKKIEARKKVLIMGNHDSISNYKELFDEIYSGPLFISNRILLSHEPVCGLSYCLNIHGHEHDGEFEYIDQFGCKHINLASNVCGYTPYNLKNIISTGIMKNIPTIHRETIERAKKKKSGGK